MRSMNTIKSYRKQARVRATAKGNSHQSELNAIAREHGHAGWGVFQRHLARQETASSLSMTDEDAIETEALVDAYQAARAAGGHLVVLRASREAETAAIARVRNGGGEGLEGMIPTETLTADAMDEASRRGETLVAGSGTMPRNTTRGHFIVHNPMQELRQGASLVSRRDQRTIYATTALQYSLPQNDEDTVSLIQKVIGETTMRQSRSAPFPVETIFASVDDGGMGITADWNMPVTRRPADWRPLPFVPAFNVLGPKFLPAAGPDRDAHLERIAGILIPEVTGRNDYFDIKGRHIMVGLLHIEVERAERDGRAPTIPAMLDWLSAGLRRATDEDRASAASDQGGTHLAGDALSDWLTAIVQECEAKGYHPRARAEILPLVSMPPNERSGILGTVDKGLLVFKNRETREMNS